MVADHEVKRKACAGVLLFIPVAILSLCPAKPFGGAARCVAVRLVCIVDLVFVVGWCVFISGTNDVTNLSRSRDPLLYLLEILGVIAAMGTLIVILHAFRSWAKTGKWIWAKLFDVALALACISFTWFIWHWNLINFNLRY